MKLGERIRKAIIMIAVTTLLVSCSQQRRTTPPEQTLPQTVFEPLREHVRKSYIELFQTAPTLQFTPEQVQAMREYLKQSRDYCKSAYQVRTIQYDRQLREAQAQLMMVGYREGDRHEMHCSIQNLSILRERSHVFSREAVDNAYSNREAKLRLIQEWPAEMQRIKQNIASGEFRKRPYANVEDIGFREVQRDQDHDIDDGEEAVRRLRMTRMMPQEIRNRFVEGYVTELAEKIAKHSDLQIPVHVTVLNSKEINAFALPGGFLFVQRGLLETAEDEAELAGVISHEMAHVTARHGHRMMRKARIANILYSAVRVAGAITGANALAYTGMGLGLALNLDVLGVNRDFELEADQLGIQYAWHAGYDPTGFIRFFDRMAAKKGYATGASWFRTHPPFYERMVRSQAELMYLPEKTNYIEESVDFERMKEELDDIPVRLEREDMRMRPQFRRLEDCPYPSDEEFDSDPEIKSVCDLT
jgi:hypothetical protein